MVQKCVVRGCESTWYPGCHITFHSFPKNIIQRNLWLSLVPFKTKFYECARICSLHFKEEDYDFKACRLKEAAFPSFNDNSQMDQKPCEDIVDMNMKISCLIMQEHSYSVKDIGKEKSSANENKTSKSVILQSSDKEKLLKKNFMQSVRRKTKYMIIINS